VLKSGGLEVYDLRGRVVQSLAVTQRPPLTAADPASPGPQPDLGTGACPDSESGETFGRYNNVAIAYGFPLRRPGGGVRRVDLAVVTDRGCDRLRFFVIDPGAAGGPLVDVTASAAPRVFPMRVVQPSPLQSPGEHARVEANPVDDQSTAYGLAVYARGSGFQAAVTQRSRSVIGLVDLVATADGRVSYQRRAELIASPMFRVRARGGGWLDWTPCREAAVDDPQFEGLVYDADRRVLFASQEVVGVWSIPLDVAPHGSVRLHPQLLTERVRSFGAPYWAVPDDDEFSCEDAAPAPLPPGTVVSAGNRAAGGEHLVADVEGLALVTDDDGDATFLLVSSQGDDSIHAYRLGHGGNLAGRHRAAFRIDGASGTDGLEVVTGRVGDAFPNGLLVVHDGAAAPPASTAPINGYEYAESTGFVLVDWDDVDDLL
jgi:3-phytase